MSDPAIEESEVEEIREEVQGSLMRPKKPCHLKNGYSENNEYSMPEHGALVP
jgi:hypothetical protein